MQITPAVASDAAEATQCMTAAFATDPLISYFFQGGTLGRDRSAEAFFSILFRVRVALGMPALVAKENSRIQGVAMGYRTDRLEWPAPFEQEWQALESSAPGIDERFAAYEQISDAAMPPEPHYYLGVIGVAPAAKGKGVGAALLDAFCALSEADPLSSGVYLETGSPENLPFYQRNGFKVRGEGRLGEGALWCLFHPHSRARP